MHDHTRPSPEGKHSAPDPSPRGERIPREQWDQMFPGQLRKLAELVDLWLEREHETGSPAFRRHLAQLSRWAGSKADERDGLISGMSTGSHRSPVRRDAVLDVADRFAEAVLVSGARSWRSWEDLARSLDAPNRAVARDAVAVAVSTGAFEAWGAEALGWRLKGTGR